MESKANVEIERKYVIEKPDVEKMRACDGYTASEIVQIYLASPIGVTRRIRSRAYPDRISYFETSKIRIDKMSSHEFEREIDKAEFDSLATLADPQRRPIIKTRYTFTYSSQLFEVDVYPEWERTCIMETELKTRDTEVEFPDFIHVVSEVTGDKRYSNAGMARAFPEELKNAKAKPATKENKK